MKAITVRQPWAWAIMHAGKDVENRSRNIAGTYRGLLVIHQGKRPIPASDPGRDLILRLTGRLPLIEDPRTLGAALGIVELVDVVPPHPRCSYCTPWAEERCWQLELRKPRWFPEPIPYRGQLGLWEFPQHLLPEGFIDAS